MCGLMPIRLLLLRASHAYAYADCADIDAISNYGTDADNSNAFTDPIPIADADATDIHIYDRSDPLSPVATAEPDPDTDRSNPD